MAVTPTDFLTISEVLIQNSDEISHRGAASRAYYSAYHKVCNALTGPIPHYKCGTHEALTTYLKSADAATNEAYDIKLLHRVSLMLINMKTQRHIADYDLADSYSKDQGQSVITMAHRIIQMIDAA